MRNIQVGDETLKQLKELVNAGAYTSLVAAVAAAVERLYNDWKAQQGKNEPDNENVLYQSL